MILFCFEDPSQADTAREIWMALLHAERGAFCTDTSMPLSAVEVTQSLTHNAHAQFPPLFSSFSLTLLSSRTGAPSRHSLCRRTKRSRATRSVRRLKNSGKSSVRAQRRLNWVGPSKTRTRMMMIYKTLQDLRIPTLVYCTFVCCTHRVRSYGGFHTRGAE